MYYNGDRSKHVATFLNEVHTAMEAKYGAQKAQSTADAAELQRFFQELKFAAQHRDDENVVNNAIIDLILDTVEQIGKSKNSKYNIKNLFGVRGGIRFENEIAKVIQAVYENITDGEFDFDSSQVLIGSQIGGTAGLEQMFDKDVQKILKTIGTKTQRKIEDDAKKKKMFYLADVSGKIDVKGYTINVKADPDPELLRIYQLLESATFSAKNYDSMSWDEKLKMFVEATGHSSITLGNSNLFRAVYGVLGSLGQYDDKTITSAFWAGYNKVKQGNQDVSNHFFHLRYIYELAGAGITYGGTSLGEVKYLIYNDPHGGIYVKSTAEILSDVLNNDPAFKGNPFSEIAISKSVFGK